MGASKEIELKPVRLISDSPAETVRIAARLAELLRAGDVIALQGTLGAGKTWFVKGLARGLGVKDPRAVTSPSFVLMREYRGRLALYHFDAYRLENEREMEEIGCYEIFESGGVSVVEWANHVPRCLPREHLLIIFRVTGESRRELLIAGVGPGPLSRMNEIAEALKQWQV